MSDPSNYDRRGASAAAQVVNLERMLQERDEQIERLEERVAELEGVDWRARFDKLVAWIGGDAMDQFMNDNPDSARWFHG